MKLFFFLAVLANITLFMWEYKTGALTPVKTTSTQNTTSNDEEPILLVSELKISPTTTTTVPPAPEPPATLTQPITDKAEATVMRCYEVGPFTKKSDAQQWVKQLTDSTATIKLVNKNEQIANKYMVYYPAAKTLENSEANLQILKERGVNDLFIQRTAKDKGDISLGVFSKEERALILKNQMLEKGIEVKIKPLYTTKAKQYALVKSKGALPKNTPQLTVKELFPCQ
jgi:hypothetical protein